MGNNIIEINGQRYDTVTGESLTTPKYATNIAPTSQVPTKLNLHDVVRKPAKAAPRHAPVQSQTLMRSAVKKPADNPKKLLKARSASELASRFMSQTVEPHTGHLKPERLQRAKRVNKSELVSHFSGPTSEATFRPPAPRVPVSPSYTKPELPAKKPKTTTDILEQAINQATSHEQPVFKLKRKTNYKPAIAMLAVLLVLSGGAVLGYKNLSKIEFNIASAKAGFSASQPGYKPAGFDLGQLDYSSGAVAASFHNKDSQLSYNITEKRTSWNSQDLLNNFIAPAYDTSYKTVTKDGLTIYIYGNHNATWVSKGIWYVIQSDGSLTNQQLAQLATSL